MNKNHKIEWKTMMEFETYYSWNDSEVIHQIKVYLNQLKNLLNTKNGQIVIKLDIM